MCGLAVALGAFGAHALNDLFSDTSVSTWRTATLYLMFHGVAVIALSTTAKRDRVIAGAVECLVIGSVFFCGSLFALALGAPSFFGVITPIGGVIWIASWLVLSYRFFIINKPNSQ